MNPITYDTIAPNIAKVDVDGAVVRVSWRCPSTGREVGQSTASMAADPSLAGKVQANVQRSIASEIIYGAARMISGLMGGAAGRVIGSAVNTAASDINTRVTAGVDYTEDSKRAAILIAFESVKPSFVWNEQQQKFIAPQNLPTP